ncbi:MAG: alpha/beta hydrolase [Spongiibacteraceae bacterium]
MKITKNMLDVGLQKTYAYLAILPAILRFKWMVKLVHFLESHFLKGKNIDGLVCEERYITSSDGRHKIRVLIHRPKKFTGKLPALLYYHGGGYIMGKPEHARSIIKSFIQSRPCVVIAPDYRKAFSEPFPAGFNDCYDTLLWAKDNAEKLNVFPEKLIVAGHSAGGGLTAAVTLKARDTHDVDIAFQMPIYPMIDDLQPTDPVREIATPVWDTRMNKLGWGAYLSALHEEGVEIPGYAAPARNKNYQGFPPTITFVGTLEPFYWETLTYVESLKSANIEVVYEVYKGCYHAFDILGGSAKISKDARAFTFQNFGLFYDKYATTKSAVPQSKARPNE